MLRLSEQGLAVTLQLLDVFSTGAAGRCIWKLDGAGLEDGPAGEFAAGEEGPPAKGVGEPVTEEEGEEAAALVAAALFETTTDGEAAVVVAALFEAEAAAEEEDEEELGLERIKTPVLTAASGLVIPLDPTVPGVAIGTAVAWTAYPPGPPLDGRTVPTAGAIAKPTSAISPTTSTHHVRERSALMTATGERDA